MNDLIPKGRKEIGFLNIPGWGKQEDKK